MAKKAISSVELAALVHELQFLVDGKISQIYHPEKKELVLQYYARNNGKGLLRIIPGKFLNLTNEKKSVLRPSGFCMQLRKYLNGAFIREVYQVNSERIVVFVLETAEYVNDVKQVHQYKLVAEFFSKGNLLVTDENWEIIGTLARQHWESRTIKAREKYELPPEGFNWRGSTEQDMKKIFSGSEKKNLATSLATEMSLGGVFAEEICARAGVDAKKLPEDVTLAEIKALYASLQSVMVDLKKSEGLIFEDDSMSPIRLDGKVVKAKYENYSAALDTIDPFEKVSPYQQKIANAKKIISQQEQSIEEIENKIAVNSQKGEKIYEHYANLQKLLDIVKDLRKKHDWDLIKNELKKEKSIKGIDLKSKKITIDL